MTAYIWDLDGTLLDSYGVIVESAARTAAEAGVPDSAEDVLRGVKQGTVTSYLTGVSARSGISLQQFKERDKLHSFSGDLKDTCTPME